jgi:hypothetical protein
VGAYVVTYVVKNGDGVEPVPAVGQARLQLVHELPGGAPAPAGVPAVPEDGPFLELLGGDLYPAPVGEAGDDLEVPPLVGGREGYAQAEARRERELLLHGVAGVDVVVVCPALIPVGETLADQIAAVGGGVDPDVLRRLLDAALQQRLERLVLDLVLLERQVVHEEDEPRRAGPQESQHPRQRLEVLLRHLDEPQPPIGVLVQDGLDGGGLPGPRQAVEERVVGR